MRWCAGLPGRVVVIWDNAPGYIAKMVSGHAAERGPELVALPGYSPELNPIERLWDWMREAVTRGHCHESLSSLRAACQEFIARINADAIAVVDGLGPKFNLDPEQEAALWVSTCTGFRPILVGVARLGDDGGVILYYSLARQLGGRRAQAPSSLEMLRSESIAHRKLKKGCRPRPAETSVRVSRSTDDIGGLSSLSRDLRTLCREVGRGACAGIAELRISESSRHSG